jgi:hypothetical protein
VGSHLTVSRVDGVSALLRFATDIDRLNAASSRPNAFSSFAFLHSYALRNEYRAPGNGECLFLVREQGKVIGYAPMREVKELLSPSSLSPFAISGTRLEFLAAGDTEQLGFVCASGDEERVASATIRHFCEREARWGMVELVGQRPGNALHGAVHAARGGRFWARDIAVQPYTEVPLIWPDLPRYFRSLTKHMRSNIGRQARRMYAAGRTELVLAQGAQAVGAWFDAYLDLDSRSWKQGTESSVARVPRRVRFFREIANGKAGFDPSFVGVVLDGVLVAGLLIGSNQSESPTRHGSWCLEMAFDRTRADLGPGQLLLLMAAGEALARGDVFLNFLQNFAYYKHRWGAESIDVVNVQLIRRLTSHDGRARIGDLRRWWLARQASKAAGDRAPNAEPVKERAEPEPDTVAMHDPVIWERARTVTATALACAGPGMRVLDREAARRYLPFDLE